MKGSLETNEPLLQKKRRVPVVTTEKDAAAVKGPAATRDHDVIRNWALRRHAEPATGEATPSGPATAAIKDEGAGIRFNFPGSGRLRPITWEEWFANFDRHQLTFVYEDHSETNATYRIVKAEDWSDQIR
jgi:hypothetical protein